MHYLDANATEPPRPEATAAMTAAFAVTGNPSSVHAPGRAARRVVEDARERIAGRFGARAQDLVFTSGGTEADVTAVHAFGAHAFGAHAFGTLALSTHGLSTHALSTHAFGTGRPVLIGATEHDAIRAAVPPDTAILPVDRHGIADLDHLRRWLSVNPRAFVCLMHANNETGAIQPIAEAAALCRAHGATLHVDAAQSAGRLPVDLRALGCHSLALSAHKMGGPAGIGALLLSPEHSAITPLIAGGGQELGRRGGTHALIAIAGFAAVCGPLTDQTAIEALRDRAERAAVACGAIVCGSGAPRLPNTLSIALPGVSANRQVIALDLDGIAVSAGAACSSGKVQTSHVLTAMGLGPLAGEAIRVSLPWNVTEAAIDAFAASYARMAARMTRPLVHATS